MNNDFFSTTKKEKIEGLKDAVEQHMNNKNYFILISSLNENGQVDAAVSVKGLKSEQIKGMLQGVVKYAEENMEEDYKDE